MQKPYRDADDSFVIPMYARVPGLGLAYLNAMVIRGKEPVLVDTAGPVRRAEYHDAAKRA